VSDTPQSSTPADAVATSLLAVWAYLCSTVPAAWTRELDGAMAGTTGLPVAMMNGVFVANERAPRSVVAALVEDVASAGLPYCLQLRPNCDPALFTLASSLRLHPQEDVPVMALTALDAVERTLDGATAALRALDPAEAGLHCTVASDGFEMPEEIIGALVGPAALALPGVKAYIAEVDGEPLSTALAITLDGHVGIFNVATPAAHRRRGFGAAVTAIAVRDAFADGARRAWLQTSPLGRSTYERLGFSVVESWKCWASVPSAE
jgi:ribosomal protein S18 acetylase RimI-like enzyme